MTLRSILVTPPTQTGRENLVTVKREHQQAAESLRDAIETAIRSRPHS